MKKMLFVTMMAVVIALFAGMPLTANAQQQKTGVKRTTSAVKKKKSTQMRKVDKTEADTAVYKGDYVFSKTIFYPKVCQNWIQKSEFGKVKELADSIRAHSDCKVLIEGFSDKGAEGPLEKGIPQKLSDARTERVKQMLINNYKIDESLITTKGYGCRVQPFPLNERNRCVIVYIIP